MTNSRVIVDTTKFAIRIGNRFLVFTSRLSWRSGMLDVEQCCLGETGQIGAVRQDAVDEVSHRDALEFLGGLTPSARRSNLRN